jgi:hypothetical protein
MAEIRKPDDNQKLLIEIIKRFDTYINASNAKIAVILSYCMAYIGGLGFKLVDISGKRVHDAEWCFLLTVCLLSAGVTLWAARFAYQALAPQVPSGRAAHEQPSVVFFGDVATHPGGRDGYVTSVLQLTEEEVVRDLASQAYTLAAITHSKFALIDKATKYIVYFQIPLFALILVLLLTALQPPDK